MRPLRTVLLICLLSIPLLAQIELNGNKLGMPSTSQEPVSIEVQPVGPVSDSLAEFEILLKMAPQVHIYSAESLFFEIGETEIKGLGPSRVQLPPPAQYKNFDGSTVSIFTGGQKVRIAKPILDSQWVFEGYIQYQACDTSKCFMPAKKHFRFTNANLVAAAASAPDPDVATAGDADWQTALQSFTVLGKNAGYQSSGQFLDFLKAPGQSGAAGAFAGKSLLLVILLVLLGGIALNFTPCVLPMIPITLAVIGAGAVSGTKRRGFLLGGVYGLGMAIAYGALGVVVALSGAQFGIINASPVFNFFIALVFILLALGMFDLIHIDFTRFRSGLRHDGQKKGHVVPVFFMGILAALLAGACVAPVVISVVLYATSLYAAGQPLAMALPFLLGLAMALPWPFAGAGMAFLPKPGTWMVWVRNIFGVLILAMAAYYGHLGLKLLKPVPAAAAKQHSSSSSLPWHTSLAEGLAAAAAQNKPVLIDFWATWCKNCTAMDATTFTDAEVQKRLADYVLIKYQAENPEDPATSQILKRFGIIGLPTYVVLTKK
jgi:thiol:disulfide interchange protein